MSDVKTAVKRMAVYYLLLVGNAIPCASIIPDRFPTRNLSTIYLLILSVCLVLYYYYRVPPAGGIYSVMKALSWMGLLLILLRGIKYSAFAEVGVLARHTWYFYYVPMLLIPLFLLYISLFVSPGKNPVKYAVWRISLILTVAFIAIVLTNDLHQLVFRFKPGFADWDNDYSRGWLFFVLTVWQYALYFFSIIILVVKCRVGSSKKAAWIVLIPFTVGIAMYAATLTGSVPRINGSPLFEFPEALIFTAATVLECCMQLGLIPTNTDYGKLFRNFSVSAQITDKNGVPVYSSQLAVPLTSDQFSMPGGSRISEHTVLNKMEISGGYGFWQDDMTGIDRLNEELAEAREGLAQEAELIRLRNELKEKQTKIEQRTLVYDTIAMRTQSQSQLISQLAEEARGSSDPSLKDDRRRRITLLGAYIKRYANLMLLSREKSSIETGELALSVSEVLRYLNYCGIPGEIVSEAYGTVSSEEALYAFEAFEKYLETFYPYLRGLFVNLSTKGDLHFKLAFEVLPELPDHGAEDQPCVGVPCEIKREDNVIYVSLSVSEGRDAV
ncbi:MAG: hypothetical protein IJR90_05095 [Clostridia bacterium]|nr:hypothetical protein [Clostridia bacterium]